MRLFHFYLLKWAGPTLENTYNGTKNIALSDRIGFKKIQDGVFVQFKGKHLQILPISKKISFDMVIAT